MEQHLEGKIENTFIYIYIILHHINYRLALLYQPKYASTWSCKRSKRERITLSSSSQQKQYNCNSRESSDNEVISLNYYVEDRNNASNMTSGGDTQKVLTMKTHSFAELKDFQVRVYCCTIYSF